MMNKSRAAANPWILEVLFFWTFFLTFFQLISDFVEAIYAFGLLGTSIPPEIASVLFFFSPLVLLFLRNGITGKPLAVTGTMMLVARLAEPLLDTRGRMLVAGLGVSCWLLFLPGLLAASGEDQKRRPAALAAGLYLAAASLNLFKALNSGLDLTIYGVSQALAWPLALFALWYIWRRLGNTHDEADHETTRPPASLMGVVVMCMGLAAVLVLYYFAFASLNIIVRWAGLKDDISYLIYLLVGTIHLAGYLFLVWKPALTLNRAPAVWSANLVFVAALVITILSRQITFPGDAGAYPIYELPAPAWGWAGLAVMLIFSPVLLVDFYLFSRSLIQARPAPKALGAGFSFAALFILVMIFAHVFTTVYDYIPVVGPFFRDRFWLVYLMGGAGLILPLLFLNRAGISPVGFRMSWGVAVAILAPAVLSTIGAGLSSQRLALTSTERSSIKVFTYNIQQGYGETGQRSFNEQLAVLQAADADLIGLQESDTNRIAGGNADLVRYFADNLKMYSYYGPGPVVGTFGIALLSRYPIQKPVSFFMYSQGEQTAAIWAEVLVGGRAFNIFVTHLGNGGPLVQQEQFLQVASGKSNIIAMGDFNFKPDTDQYRLTRSSLEDAWMLKWPEGIDDQGLHPVDRIDHVFLSPGLEALDAQYLTGPASDHPAVLVEVGW